MRGVIPWLLLGAGMLIAAYVILDFTSDLTFFRDEWEFVLFRDGRNLDTFLASHAGHLVAWPALIFLVGFKTAGLNHYWVFVVPAVIAHLSCVGLIYVIARQRLGAWGALAPAIVMLLLGSSWMDLLWPFQICFTGGIASGLAALLLIDRDTKKGDAAACVMLVFAIGWSGVALPFLLATAVGLAVKRRTLRAIWVTGIPAVIYLAWSVTSGDTDIDYAANLIHAPGYGLKMAAQGVIGITGAPLLFAEILVIGLVVLTCARLWALRRTSPLAWEALALGLSYWGLTAIARVQFDDPGANRYVYGSVVALMLLTVGIAPVLRGFRWVPAVLIALALVTVPHNLGKLREGRDSIQLTSKIVRAELGSVELAQSLVDPGYIPSMQGFYGVPAGPYLEAVQEYRSSPAATPAEIPELGRYFRKRADAVLQSALASSFSLQFVPPTEADVPGGAPPFVGYLPIGRTTLHGPCVVTSRGRSLVQIRIPAGGVSIAAGHDAPVLLSLRRFSDHFGPSRYEVEAGKTGVLRIPADASDVPWYGLTRARSGPVKFCSLRPLAP